MPWLAAFAGLMAAFLVLPELAAIAVSFNPTSRMVVSSTDLSGHWYVSLLAHPEYLDGFLLSFGMAAIVTVLTLFVGGAAAYGTARLGRHAAALARALFVAPLVVPVTALAVALFLLLDRLGLSVGGTGRGGWPSIVSGIRPEPAGRASRRRCVGEWTE